MGTLFLSLGFGLTLFGIMACLIMWWQPHPVKNAPRLNASARGWLNRFSVATRRNVLIGVVLGVTVAVVTGWWVFALLVPVAAGTISTVFTDNEEKRTIEKLTALESWVRSLSGLIVTGASLETALSASLNNADGPIHEPVNRLIARLESGWATLDALQQLAVELEDTTGDFITMNLMLTAKHRGAGLVTALDDLAESVQEEIRIRRNISADRAKPRLNLRIIVSIIAVVMLLLPLVEQFSFYGTAVGGLVYAGWAGLVGLVLLMMYRSIKPKTAVRLVTAKEQS